MTDIPPQDPPVDDSVVPDPVDPSTLDTVPADDAPVMIQTKEGEMVDITTLTPVEIVGVPDGQVFQTGNKVVYDYADDGVTFIGWHKETS